MHAFFALPPLARENRGIKILKADFVLLRSSDVYRRGFVTEKPKSYYDATY